MLGETFKHTLFCLQCANNKCLSPRPSRRQAVGFPRGSRTGCFTFCPPKGAAWEVPMRSAPRNQSPRAAGTQAVNRVLSHMHSWMIPYVSGEECLPAGWLTFADAQRSSQSTILGLQKSHAPYFVSRFPASKPSAPELFACKTKRSGFVGKGNRGT